MANFFNQRVRLEIVAGGNKHARYVGNVGIREGVHVGTTTAQKTNRDVYSDCASPKKIIHTLYPTGSTQYSTVEKSGIVAENIDGFDFSTYPRR